MKLKNDAGTSETNENTVETTKKPKPRARAVRYKRRLEKLGLPRIPSPYVQTEPSPLQLAQLAAALKAGQKGSFKPAELVDEALRLWNAAKVVPFANKQARILMLGLMVFRAEEWRAHAASLICAVRDPTSPIPVKEALALKARLRVRASKKPHEAVGEMPIIDRDAMCRASKLVAKLWRNSCLTNGHLLNALFNGSGGCQKEQCESLVILLAFAKKHAMRNPPIHEADIQPTEDALRAPPAEEPEILTMEDIRRRERRMQRVSPPSELQIYEASIQQACDPLFPESYDEARLAAKLVRLHVVRDPIAFANDDSLVAYPKVARWLAVMNYRKHPDKEDSEP